MANSESNTMNVHAIIEILGAVKDKIDQRVGLVETYPWVLSDDKITSPWVRRFHRFYTFLDFGPPFPLSMILTLAVMVSFVMETVLLASILKIHQVGFPPWFLNNLLLGLFFIISAIIVLSSVFGTYWSFYEILANYRLAWKIKIAVFLTTAIGVAVWLFSGAPLYWQGWKTESSSLYAVLATFQPGTAYYVMAAITFYIPIIHLASLFMIKTSLGMVDISKTTIRWFFRFQSVIPMNDLDVFLNTPIDSSREDLAVPFCKLQEAHLALLRDWAESRRVSIQNKLIPFTLIIATFGLLMNTFIGDKIVTSVGETIKYFFGYPLNETFNNPSPIEWMIFFITIFLIFLPFAIVINLLRENFSADFLHEACVLALNFQKLNHRPSEDAPKPNESLLIRVIGKIFRL